MTEDELYPTPDEYDDYTMKESATYTPPKVWQWDQDGEENRFSKINRPIAGPTHDKDLPVGEHPLQLYSLATPNGVKVTVMLEELLALGISEAEYDAWLINIMEGEQFSSGFVGANPNSKIPALVDHSTPTPTGSSSREQFSSTSLRNTRNFCPLISANGPNACLGFFGRWAARPFWAVGSGTFTPMPPSGSSIQLTALPWR
jgi:GST-like protein